jgi:hypothetical protein
LGRESSGVGESSVTIGDHFNKEAARFYCRGDAEQALARAAAISAKLKGEGQNVSGTVWLTPLISWGRGSTNVHECWIELK